jgi:hypothetical protein
VIQWESLSIKGALVAIAIVLFTSCAQVATVRNVEPCAPSVGNISTPSFPTKRDARQDPETALSQTLEIAAKAWADLTRDPSNDRAVQVYNYAVGRITSLPQSTGKLPRAGAVSIGAGASTYHLTFSSEVYNYPSGYPFFYSAALLREELDQVDQTYPDHKKIILIGHSMGGLVARLMATDSNLMLWKAYFGKPPREVPMDPGPKKFIERLLIVQH